MVNAMLNPLAHKRTGFETADGNEMTFRGTLTGTTLRATARTAPLGLLDGLLLLTGP